MALELYARKVGMTHIFEEDGKMCPVTVLYMEPSQVLEIREHKNGKNVLIGFENKRKNQIKKADEGQFKRFSTLIGKEVNPKRYLKEFSIDEKNPQEEYPLGALLGCDMFQEGDMVAVRSTSKGKGFQGVMKRHGMSGGPASHGSRFHRRKGSVGAATFPGHVWKGQRLPGQTGNANHMVMNLKVVKVIPEKNILLVKGAVSGFNKALVVVRRLLGGKQHAI